MRVGFPRSLLSPSNSREHEVADRVYEASKPTFRRLAGFSRSQASTGAVLVLLMPKSRRKSWSFEVWACPFAKNRGAGP